MARALNIRYIGKVNKENYKGGRRGFLGTVLCKHRLVPIGTPNVPDTVVQPMGNGKRKSQRKIFVLST